MQENKIGIMGGTFDPIHWGHLIAAEWAQNEFGLDLVIFVPAAYPPHKDYNQVLDKNHRYNMTKKAIEGNQSFIISDFEINKSGKSYTIDTIKYLKKIYPNSELYFIMGLDSLLLLDTWKDVNGLIKLCQFIVATRPGYIINKNDSIHNKLPNNIWEKVNYLEIPQIEISSSLIRERIKQGKSIKYLLPESIEKYIYVNNIYGEYYDKN